MKRFFILSVLLAAFTAFGCQINSSSTEAISVNANADYAASKQVIEGFGGSNAWNSLPGDPEVRSHLVRLLYSRTDGIGLNILRTRIPFRENSADYRDGFISFDADGEYIYTEQGGRKYFEFNWQSWEIGNTRNLIRAIENLGESGPEDLIIKATPWTPPNNWKTGYPNAGLPAYGGRLKHEHYADYADVLADFSLQYEANMGRRLNVISVQNEPDYVPTSYESCGWTANEIRDFLKIMGPAFAAKNVDPDLRIMAPESMHLKEAMILPTLRDPEARAVLDIVGLHQYNHDEEFNMGAIELPTVKEHGLPLWQTEVSTGERNDPSIKDGVYWAKLIHLDMTVPEVNAFLYWWLWSTNSDSKGNLINIRDGALELNKRLFTLGQFSRFIRPGWERVESDHRPVMGLYTSMYRDPESDEFALVIVNERKNPVDLAMTVAGVESFQGIELWRTSDTENLELQRRGARTEGNVIEVQSPAMSVSTVYGRIQ